MNVFNWFARPTERLIQLRSQRIWGNLTSQPVPVIIRTALFCIYSSLLDNTTIIKMRQNQWFVHWDKNPLRANWFQSPQGSKCFCDFTTEFSMKVFHQPTRLGICRYWHLSIDWPSRQISGSLGSREILCQIPVNRHLVLGTIRLKRLESSHCFRMARSWVRDENKSSGFLEE